MEAKNKDLWVFIETDQEGRARNVGLELLNPGRRLADKQGGELIGVVIGCGIEEAVKAGAGWPPWCMSRKVRTFRCSMTKAGNGTTSPKLPSALPTS